MLLFRMGGIEVHGNFVGVSHCLQSHMIAPCPVLFHPSHVRVPVLVVKELHVVLWIAPELVDGRGP